MSEPRERRVYPQHNNPMGYAYTVRVEAAVDHRWLRTDIYGWRFVGQRCFGSQFRGEHVSDHDWGKVRPTKEEAIADGHAWLDLFDDRAVSSEPLGERDG